MDKPIEALERSKMFSKVCAVNKSRSKLITLLIAIFLALAASASVLATIIKFQDIPFPWDPAGHACEGLRIAQDLKAWDILSFCLDTYQQAFWPFFHSWLLAPAFILFGNTYAAARTVSLFCLLLFVPTIYLVGIEMSPKRGHWIGLMSVYLTLSSLPILVLSCMCMTEIPGLLMTFLTFLLYLKSKKYQKPVFFICTSVLMALTLFTKWHHGVFLIPAILVTQLTTDRRILSRTNRYLFFPFFALILAWFIHPQHISSFYHHSTFQPHFYSFFSLDNLLFYPKSFLRIYHSSPIISVAVGIFFILSLKALPRPEIRLFIIYILVGITLLTIKLDNRHRYIITLVPSIWILATTTFADFVHYLKFRMNNHKLKLVLTLASLTLFFLISLASIPRTYAKYPNSLVNYNYYCDERLNSAYAFISNNASTYRHIAVFSSWDYYNSPKGSTIKWNIEVKRANDTTEQENNKIKALHYFLQLLKNKSVRSYHDLVNFLTNRSVRVEEYHLLSFRKTLNTDSTIHQSPWNSGNPFTDNIIDVTSIDDDISCLIAIYKDGQEELNSYAQHFFSQQTDWSELNAKYFSDLGIRVVLYQRGSLP